MQNRKFKGQTLLAFYVMYNDAPMTIIAAVSEEEAQYQVNDEIAEAFDVEAEELEIQFMETTALIQSMLDKCVNYVPQRLHDFE